VTNSQEKRANPLPRLARRDADAKSRGATLVEFALIAVILFTLIFGIIEGAFAVRARNAVDNAVNDAARAGAVAGSNSDADWQVLNQLVGRGAHQASDIQYVTVYNATSGSEGSDPEACELDGSSQVCQCLSGVPQAGICNVYGPNTLEQVNTNRAAFVDGSLGTQWPPATRGTADTLGFIGVYVRSNYEPIFNQIFFEWNFDLNAQDLQALETSGEL